MPAECTVSSPVRRMVAARAVCERQCAYLTCIYALTARAHPYAETYTFCRCNAVRHVAYAAAPEDVSASVAALGTLCLHAVLDPEPLPVPQLPSASARLARCDLFPRPQAYTFQPDRVRAFFGSLFETVASPPLTRHRLPKVC